MTAEPQGGGIGQDMGLADVVAEGVPQGGPRLFIETEKALRSGRGREDLVKQDGQRGMRDPFQSQGRFAHFADALAEVGVVLGGKVAVEAEGHLEFIDGLLGDVCDADLVEAPERVVEALDPADALRHGEARLHGLLEAGKSGKGGEVIQGFDVGHGFHAVTLG